MGEQALVRQTRATGAYRSDPNKPFTDHSLATSGAASSTTRKRASRKAEDPDKIAPVQVQGSRAIESVCKLSAPQRVALGLDALAKCRKETLSLIYPGPLEPH